MCLLRDLRESSFKWFLEEDSFFVRISFYFVPKSSKFQSFFKNSRKRFPQRTIRFPTHPTWLPYFTPFSAGSFHPGFWSDFISTSISQRSDGLNLRDWTKQTKALCFVNVQGLHRGRPGSTSLCSSSN